MAKTKKAAPDKLAESIDAVLDEQVLEANAPVQPQVAQGIPVEQPVVAVVKPDTYRVNFSKQNVLRGVRRQNLHYGGGGEPRYDVVLGVSMGEDTEGFVIPSVPARLIEQE
ncbi:hypothetical protein [Hymenobacter glacieicola]|uniref:Uncharacterized protein n=1 Tax=Hymenobacter glacieicola TaxID=1562124 RepID=A0ABQ1X7E9_9BACT|nr:hypothetical protein [Hymenobacter glacieicola]GGG61375.1 hypothetical protein GCM10011378_41770 [Hymenobacter glacieicola]